MPRTLGPETPGTRRRLGQSNVTLATSGGTRFADVVCILDHLYGFSHFVLLWLIPYHACSTVKWYVVDSYLPMSIVASNEMHPPSLILSTNGLCFRTSDI